MFVQYKADQTEYFFFFLQMTVPKILWHGIYSTFHDRKKNFQAINSKNELIIYLQRNHHFDYLTKKIIKIVKI